MHKALNNKEHRILQAAQLHYMGTGEGITETVNWEHLSLPIRKSGRRDTIKGIPSTHIPSVMSPCIGLRPRLLLGARLCLCDRAVWQAPRQCRVTELVLLHYHPLQSPSLPPANPTTILLLN
jgi:hypothetical protein